MAASLQHPWHPLHLLSLVTGCRSLFMQPPIAIRKEPPMRLIKRNPDLAAATLLALVTACFSEVSPSSLIESINFQLLALLFSLMTIVAALRHAGFFSGLFGQLFRKPMKSRQMGRVFVFLSFFTSMVFTNDVSLIIFVPLAISLFKEAHALRLVIPVLTWMTIAANLGSMLTPIGNPQNLFIYDHYHLPLAEFLSITAPISVLSGILLFLASYTLEDRPLMPSFAKPTGISRLRIVFLLLLFALCLLHVLRLLPISFLLAIVIPACAFLDRKAFLEVDYKLLALFLVLFIAVGNLTHIPGLQERPAALLAGHEFWISLLLSQVVSNVPATVMLSPYTENYTALLLGVNIGGLGTLIASMASLISFKAYLSMRFHFARAYFLVFTGANLGFLAVLIGAYLMLLGD